MKCPICELQLHRILYESVPVFRCLKCHGHLLAEKRLEGICRSTGTDIEQLQQEVILETRPDTKKKIRCPRCGRKMDKRVVEKLIDLSVDSCRECHLIWLDGGELSQLQLNHEMTPKAQEARRFRKRQQSLTDEELSESDSG